MTRGMTPALPTRLAALCDALRARGATIYVATSTTMRVRGAGLTELADEIRYWKPELIRGLIAARGADPFACARCGCEVVLDPAALCRWCAHTGTCEFEICPNSPAEVAYIERVIHSAKTSQLSQPARAADLGNFTPNPSHEEHAAA